MYSKSADEDTLSIPLTQALRLAKMDNGLFVRMGFIMFIAFLLIVASVYFYMSFRGIISGDMTLSFSFVMGLMNAVVVILLLAGIAFIISNNITNNRKYLERYDAHNIPVFRMHLRGVDCPLILLNFSVFDRLLKSGQDSLEIRWMDIESWNSDRSRIRRNYAVRQAMWLLFDIPIFPMTSGVYVVKLKGEATEPGSRIITIKNRDFSSEENGKIMIRTIEEENNQVIEVEDNGEGIPRTILPKIFEPLFTTKSFGTGLGLASCKNIIESHKGTITVQSSEGVKTIFRIKLPKNSKQST